MKYRTILEACLKELWSIRNPSLKLDEKTIESLNKTIKNMAPNSQNDLYKQLQHISDDNCFDLTTARNRNLITPEEQTILRSKVVGFFGLSVGSHAALTWMMESRADKIKIVDPDIIMPTNLNRLRFGWGAVGKFKVDVVNTQLKEINPDVQVISSKETDEISVENIFQEDARLDVVIDEIDSLQGKLLLRRIAKKNKIPLISATDVGDNVFVDIEDYSKFPQPEFFLGRIPNIDEIDLNKLSLVEKRKLVIHYVGLEHNSEKMLNSLLNIGKSIITWPQLGATATISGGIVATLIKKILLSENVKSGRYYIDLEEIFVDDYNSNENISERERLKSYIKSSSK